MRNTLEKIYQEYLSSGEQGIVPGSSYAKTLDILVRKEKKLYRKVKDHALLASFTDAQGDLSLIAETEAFVKGFRLGARIMLEVLGENDGSLTGIMDK